MSFLSYLYAHGNVFHESEIYLRHLVEHIRSYGIECDYGHADNQLISLICDATFLFQAGDLIVHTKETKFTVQFSSREYLRACGDVVQHLRIPITPCEAFVYACKQNDIDETKLPIPKLYAHSCLECARARSANVVTIEPHGFLETDSMGRVLISCGEMVPHSKYSFIAKTGIKMNWNHNLNALLTHYNTIPGIVVQSQYLTPDVEIEVSVFDTIPRENHNLVFAVTFHPKVICEVVVQ